jgi:hypothetical protein
MKIRIFSSFCDSIGAKNTLERIFQSHLIPEYNTDFTITAGEDYTHVIILNVAMPKIEHIPKERVIGLAYEPPYYLGLTIAFIEYARKYIGKYYIGDTYDLPKPFIEHYAYMWHCNPLIDIPIKTPTNFMSIIISHKQKSLGHKYRHDLVKAILNTNLPIHIYGYGCSLYQNINDSRFKGEFKEHEPYQCYDFHIAIENFQTNHYFSEKIVNSLLCSAIPIYLGSRKINDYFPNSVISMKGILSEDIALLRAIFRNPSDYKKSIDVSYVKKKTNLLLHVSEFFSE